MRAIVCGGREYVDTDRVFSELDYHLDVFDSEIAEGGAKGADNLAWHWAKNRNVAVTTFKADWEKYGKRAGHIRNQRMLDEFKPDVVIAFPGGRGTADMVARARKAGVRIIEIPDPAPAAKEPENG